LSKLRDVRKARGMTVKQLSSKTGISFRSLGKYENGQLNIDGAKLKTLVKLSLALDCKIEDIVEDDVLVKDLKKTR
jgi:transcriptional regulator with XRE-family HTH domain